MTPVTEVHSLPLVCVTPEQGPGAWEKVFYCSTLLVAAMLREEHWKINRKPASARPPEGFVTENLDHWIPEGLRLDWQRIGFQDYKTLRLEKRESGTLWSLSPDLADLALGKWNQRDLALLAEIRIRNLEEDLQHAIQVRSRILSLNLVPATD